MDQTCLFTAAVAFLAAEAGKKIGGDLVGKAYDLVKSILFSPAGQDSDQELITPARVRERGLDRDPRLQREVEITFRRSSALRRARLVGSVLQGARVLWVDDHPANNAYERRALEALGVQVDAVTSTKEAMAVVGRAGYDVVLTDMTRSQPNSGVFLLRKLLEADKAVTVVFYTSRANKNQGLPAGAFGITDRPNELLHLVFDVLERRRV